MYRFAGRFERPVLGWGVCKVLSQNKPLVSQRGAWPGDHEEDSLSVHTLESASKSLTKLDIYEAGSGTKIADLLLICSRKGLPWLELVCLFEYYFTGKATARLHDFIPVCVDYLRIMW